MKIITSVYRVGAFRLGLLLCSLLCCTSGFSQPDLQVISQSAPTGCSASDGSVTLQAKAGTPGYRFSMDLVNFQRSPTFTGLAAGVYTFYLVDAALDFTAVSVSLNGPCAIGIGFSYSLYVCGIGGFIKVTQAFGGTPPYQYALDNNNFGNARDFEFLLSGMHHLFVRDATGLVLNYALPMYPLCDMSLTASLTNASCGGNDGSVLVDVSSGAGDYEYSLDGITYQGAPLFAGLAAGTYNISVRSRADGQMARILGLRIGSDCAVVTATSTPETCGRGDGSITAAGSRGTPPYSYSVNGVDFQNKNVFSELAGGDYTLTIKDANGFISTIPVNVGRACISVALQPVDPTCNQSNGRISVIAADAVAPFTYSKDGVTFFPDNVFDNLPAGQYIITVKDARGVINSAATTLVNPSSAILTPVATAAGCDNDDGIITAVVSGGIAPLEFSLDNMSYQESNRFTTVASGPQTVYAKDAEGCIASAGITVPLNRELPVNAGADQTICEGTGIALPTVSAATGFSWTPATGLNDATVLQPVAAPPTTTTYTLTATKGICEASDEVTVIVQPAPVANAGPDQEDCYGKDVTLQGSGGIRYAWRPEDKLSDAAVSSPVVAHPETTTPYLLYVSDARGCRSVKPDTMILRVTPPALVFAGNDTIVSPGEPLQLTALDVNGTGFTRFEWTPAGNLTDPGIEDPVATLNNNETLTVTATTAAGCQGVDAINVKVIRGPDIYVPNAFTPNGDGRNDILKPIVVGIKTFSSFSVFNRAGQRIFYTADPANGWTGLLNGQIQPAGAYVWMVEGVDFTGKTIRRSGTAVLIR